LAGRRPAIKWGICATILACAVNDELLEANPARIVGAGRAKRVYRIRPASVAELGVLTEAMPERLRLMVTLASWCALRFGEIVKLRRGDIDLAQEVIRIRRAAVRTRGAYSITTPKSDARRARCRDPAARDPADRGPYGEIRWCEP
jgi:integrase